MRASLAAMAATSWAFGVSLLMVRRATSQVLSRGVLSVGVLPSGVGFDVEDVRGFVARVACGAEPENMASPKIAALPAWPRVVLVWAVVPCWATAMAARWLGR